MLAKEIDKSPDARTYRTVAVIDGTDGISIRYYESMESI